MALCKATSACSNSADKVTVVHSVLSSDIRRAVLIDAMQESSKGNAARAAKALGTSHGWTTDWSTGIFGMNHTLHFFAVEPGPKTRANSAAKDDGDAWVWVPCCLTGFANWRTNVSSPTPLAGFEGAVPMPVNCGPKSCCLCPQLFVWSAWRQQAQHRSLIKQGWFRLVSVADQK